MLDSFFLGVSRLISEAMRNTAQRYHLADAGNIPSNLAHGLLSTRRSSPGKSLAQSVAEHMRDSLCTGPSFPFDRT